MAGRRGPTRREELIMTQDKARKIATRQRMAETGEPYSVARHAVEDAGGDEREAAESAAGDHGAAGGGSGLGAADGGSGLRERAEQARQRAEEAQERAE